MLLAEHPLYEQCYRIFFTLQSLKYDFIALKIPCSSSLEIYQKKERKNHRQ